VTPSREQRRVLQYLAEGYWLVPEMSADPVTAEPYPIRFDLWCNKVRRSGGPVLRSTVAVLTDAGWARRRPGPFPWHWHLYITPSGREAARETA